MKSFKTALINIRRMPYKSLIAIAMISITFFVGYCFSMLLIGSQLILKNFETQPTIMAFFEIRAEAEEVEQVAKELDKHDFIDSIKLISKEEALEFYQERQDNPLLLELVTADILPASIEVSTVDPQYLTQAEQILMSFSQIDEVVLQKDVVDQLVEWTDSIRMVGLVTTSVLAVLTFFIITSTISFKIGNQSKLVGILRIIGASSGYIITPFIYEGFIYGFLGSVIGWSLMYVSFLYLMPWLNSFIGAIITLPPSWEFLALQAGIGTSMGVFFGGMASVFAGKKMIKK